MVLRHLRHWLSSSTPSRRSRQSALALERLEDRLVPSLDLYLQIPGVMDAIDLDSYSSAANHSVSTASAARGAGSGKVTFDAFQFTSSNLSSTAYRSLLFDFNQGSLLEGVNLTVLSKAGSAPASTLETWRLDHALVSSLTAASTTDSTHPIEYTFAIKVSAVTWTTFGRGQNGALTSLTTSWDTVQNGGQVPLASRDQEGHATLDFGTKNLQVGTTLSTANGGIPLSSFRFDATLKDKHAGAQKPFFTLDLISSQELASAALFGDMLSGFHFHTLELNVREAGRNQVVERLELGTVIVTSLQASADSKADRPADEFSLYVGAVQLTAYGNDPHGKPTSRNVFWNAVTNSADTAGDDNAIIDPTKVQLGTNNAALDFGQKHYQQGTTLDFGTGMILVSSNRQVDGHTLVLTAPSGIGSPGLFTLLVQGNAVHEAVLLARDLNNQPAAAWDLKDVGITSFQLSQTGSELPQDQFTLKAVSDQAVLDLQHIPVVPANGNIVGAPTISTAASVQGGRGLFLASLSPSVPPKHGTRGNPHKGPGLKPKHEPPAKGPWQKHKGPLGKDQPGHKKPEALTGRELALQVALAEVSG
jgi:type VI protein secretion system component Hcp